MSGRMFGVETEYAVTGMRGAEPLDCSVIVRKLLDSARRRLPHLPDMHSSGLYLQNGARLYLDCGLHQEFATPECGNPWDAVRYVEAGHQIMLELVDDAGRSLPPGTQAGCLRNNVDYSGSGSTWGCHESYLVRLPPDAIQAVLIPHLVTRIIYTGAGGWDPLSAGLRFTLSPRTAHLRHTVSRESTFERGIYHTKDEPLCTGYHRLHVLCGESLCSHLGMWLKIGATSLVVAMAEAGVDLGRDILLESPIDALRTVAGDVTCKQPLKVKGRGQSTALQIQRRYLECAEAHLGAAFMPPWAPEVCSRWRRMLDLLEDAPGAVAAQLDWAIKLSLYAARVQTWGLVWSTLPFWSDVLDKLNKALEPTEFRGQNIPLARAIGPESPIPAAAAELTSLVHAKGLTWDGLEQLLAVRNEFLAIDTRFGQLGPKGIFTSLDAAGVLDHRVSGVDNIEHAVSNPPASGRAHCRGEVVKRLSAEEGAWHGDWQMILNFETGRTLDLSDPFASAETWRDAPPPADGEEILESTLARPPRALWHDRLFGRR